MPPKKKKVVEEEKPVIEVSNETKVVDGVLDRTDTIIEQVVDVVETSNEEVIKVAETVKEETTKAVETVNEEATKTVETVKEDVTKTVETVKEEVTKEVENISKTLSELFLDIIKTGNLNKDIKIVLSKEATDILVKIIGIKPTFIDDVEKSLLEVVKDGKIDSNDLPHLILLIQKLYEMVYAFKEIKLDGNKRALISAEILKLLSHFLIVERRIEIANDIQSQFLDQLDKLIDSCVGLLSFSKSIKVKGCFKRIFA